MTKPKLESEKVKTGRPTMYTPELADEICNAIAYSGEGIYTLCKKHDHWPDRLTLYRWADTIPEFCSKYELARQKRMDNMVQHMQDMVEETKHEVAENGKEYPASAIVSLTNKKVDILKWALSKQRPKEYGDRLVVENNVQTHEDLIREIVKDEAKKKTKQFKSKDGV